MSFGGTGQPPPVKYIGPTDNERLSRLFRRILETPGHAELVENGHAIRVEGFWIVLESEVEAVKRALPKDVA